MSKIRLSNCKGVSFSEFLHEYITDEGVILTGVTTLMKKHHLSPDYGDIDPEILRKAAERGTAIHTLLQNYDDGKVITEDENLRAYKKLGLDVHCSEYMVSDGKTVASFVDKVLKDCSLADVKTTSAIHRRALEWQLSIYAYLFEKQNPSKKVPHLYCIWVRNGDARLVEINRIPDSQVEDLFQCEREGIEYVDMEIIPEVSLVLQDTELASLEESLDIIAQYKEALKEEEDRAAVIQDKVYQYMCENHVVEMKCPHGKFQLRAATIRKSLDSARLKAEMPDVYEKYQKTAAVKGTVVYKSGDQNARS